MSAEAAEPHPAVVPPAEGAAEAGRRLARRNQIRGILWMLLCALILACANVLVRPLGRHLHPFQIVFFGVLVSALFMTPWMLRHGLGGFRTPRPGVFATLTVGGVIATVCWYWALTVAPLAEATAISFSAPLLVVALASIVLRERVGLDRWLAVGTGFAGTLIIVRPGLVPIDFAMALVLAATAAMASVYLVTKMLAGVAPASQILAYNTFTQVVLVLPLALLTWRPVDPELIPMIVGQGVLMFFGRMTFVKALAHADASVVMPLDFARLPFIALLAWLAFAEMPDLWTVAGAVLIVGAAIFVVRRQGRA